MRSMVTQTGHIGTAPPSAQVSDEVCYIRECSVPVHRKDEIALEGIQECRVVDGACAQ
jgi:hypothetical protein